MINFKDIKKEQLRRSSEKLKTEAFEATERGCSVHSSTIIKPNKKQKACTR